eukprot:1226957-Rhodomonas_salina.1
MAEPVTPMIVAPPSSNRTSGANTGPSWTGGWMAGDPYGRGSAVPSKSVNTAKCDVGANCGSDSSKTRCEWRSAG